IMNFFRKHEEDVSGKAYRTGLNFIEEVEILTDLFNRKMINKEEISDTLILKYLKYRMVSKQFAMETNEIIRKLFYENAILDAAKLKRAYLKHAVRVRITSVINKIFG